MAPPYQTSGTASPSQVGTIAGSTIMLLTLPWGMSIFKGAVPIDPNTGAAVYARRKEAGGMCQIFSRGVTPDASIRSNALFMALTSLIYLVIQGPAFQYAMTTTPDIEEKVSKLEHWFAFVGLVLAVLAFVAYLFLMVMQSRSDRVEYLINAKALREIESNNPTSIVGVIAPFIGDGSKAALARGGSLTHLEGALLDNVLVSGLQPRTSMGALLLSLLSRPLAHQPCVRAHCIKVGKEKLTALLKPFFRAYDVNHDGRLSSTELGLLLQDLGESSKPQAIKDWMARLDPQQNGWIERDHFTDAMLEFIRQKALKGAGGSSGLQVKSRTQLTCPRLDPTRLADVT